MYESEANWEVGSAGELPRDIVERFGESRRTVSRRTLFPWSEHCTECVWPTCYTTCELYRPRGDGRCRRFVDGMVRINCPQSLNSYVVRITFKRWGKLWSEATLNTYTLPAADRAERVDAGVAQSIRLVPLSGLRNTLTHKRYSMKKRLARRTGSFEAQPNCFLLEAYNPNPAPVSMTVTMRQESRPIPFQALLKMEPGFNRHRLAVADIERLLDISDRISVDLTPNDIEDGVTLYFGGIDFVVDAAFTATAPKSRVHPCKCVIWDLDNTLWEGVLIEDGAEKLRLRPGVAAILQELDRRGILLSVASKNNPEEAMSVLRRFGIEDYFLFPQISWEPKSRGIQQIAANLNIGIDACLFVDDTSFEREEVRSACKEIMILDAADYQTILDRPDCQLPVTQESARRRFFYRDQERRELARHDFHGEYVAFLRDCRLRLTIRPMSEANLERVHELTQRTNQMNFSGNRYSREELRNLLGRPEVDAYVLDCEDRFGSYGTVGFCVAERSDEACITDMMFSCRIQSKHVEHAVVAFLIREYRGAGMSAVFVNYRKTKKNAASGKVFDDFGFRSVAEFNGVSRLIFPPNATVPDEGIVEIDDSGIRDKEVAPVRGSAVETRSARA